MARLGCIAAMVAAVGAAPAPADVAKRAITQLVNQSFNSEMWQYEYGPAIQMSAMWEASKVFPGQDWSGVLNQRLAQFTSTNTYPAWMILNNVSVPWGYSIGDVAGLLPIAFVSRADYYGVPATNTSSPDWQVALTTLDDYVLGWPKRIPDGTISRDQSWPGEPDVNASFLWNDDFFMGTTLAARVGKRSDVPTAKARTYLDFAAKQLVQAVSYFEDSDGLYFHGYNHATGDHSCCKWGRANGWTMMAAAEIVSALSQAWPDHPLLPQLIGLWRRHSAGLAAVQDKATGLWHQVLDVNTTFLETSVSAMTLYSVATGVLGGWLDRTQYDGLVRSAWGGVSSMVDATGVVYNISCGTGIGTTAEWYNQRPTAYGESAPGLGAVFRAALVYNEYINAYGA